MMPNLDRFIMVKTDQARLALGAEVLQAAYSEAETSGLAGWSNEIYEYIVALRDGKGLNRPLNLQVREELTGG